MISEDLETASDHIDHPDPLRNRDVIAEREIDDRYFHRNKIRTALPVHLPLIYRSMTAFHRKVDRKIRKIPQIYADYYSHSRVPTTRIEMHPT